MAYPYFIWRDVDSRSMGVWVAQYPSRVRAAERVNRVTIPGRAGQLTLSEGEAVYEPIDLQMRLQTLHKNDFERLNEWLSGSGLLVLGREPNRAYQAQIIEEVSFDKTSNDFADATIRFTAEPFKRYFPLELPDVLTDAGTVINSGDVPAKPLIVIEGSGEIALTVGDNTLTVKDVEDDVTIDCDACLVYDIDGNMMDKTSGDFPVLEVGANSVSWTGTVTSVTVTKNTRWR